MFVAVDGGLDEETTDMSSAEDYLKCDCGELFHVNEQLAYISHLRNHLEVTQAKIPYKSPTDDFLMCRHCGKQFHIDSQKAYINHIRVHIDVNAGQTYDDRKFSCKSCDREFYSKANLLMHDEVVHPVVHQYYVMSCKICSKSFATMHSLKQHICTVKNKLFKLTSGMIVPYSEHLKCSQCGKLFDLAGSQKEFISHVRSHFAINRTKPVQELQYERPDTQFISKENKEVVNRAYVNVCKICDRRFASLTLLIKHMQVPHLDFDRIRQDLAAEKLRKLLPKVKKVVPSIFPCTSCDKKYARRSGLHQHVQTCHSNFKILCEICGVALKTAGGLNAHMNSQHRGTPVALGCKSCDKVFASRGGLRHHVKICHEGQRYLCESCGKDFTTPESLVAHKRSHTGEKPFECKYCKKSFVTKLRMKVHERVHTKEKPHVCKICGNRYSQPSSLNTHRKTVHSKERPYECTVCHRKFVGKFLLNTHMKRHVDKGV